MTNLLKALAAKTAVEKMKNELKDIGIDLTEVRYITDLPAVLACMLPENMVEQAKGIVENPEAVASLMNAFGILADAGVLIDALYRPGDTVKEDDVYA